MNRVERLEREIGERVTELDRQREAAAIAAAGAALYPAVAEWMLRRRGRWTGPSRWPSRRLEGADPPAGRRFRAAFEGLFRSHDPTQVVKLVHEELQPGAPVGRKGRKG